MYAQSALFEQYDFENKSSLCSIAFLIRLILLQQISSGSTNKVACMASTCCFTLLIASKNAPDEATDGFLRRLRPGLD